eukprot:92187_1
MLRLLFMCSISSVFPQVLRLIGYDTIKSNTRVDDIQIVEISGLSYNNHENNKSIFYGMSNTLFKKQKLIFEFPLDLMSSPQKILIDNITGIPLQDPPMNRITELDTENIIYFQDIDNSKSYFIVCNEGYREYQTHTNFLLYSSNGTFLNSLLFSDIFHEKGDYTNPQSGFAEGDGVESMTITSDYSTVVWIASNTLVQDQTFNKSIRIVVNTMNYNDDIPTWTESYQFRYDKDNVDYTVPDATIIVDDLSMILVLEKRSQANDRIFTVNVYQINLYDVINGIQRHQYDISECVALNNTSCNDKKVLNKTYVGEFSRFASDMPNVESIDWDAMSVAHGVTCGIDEYFLMAASDANEQEDMYLAYICFDSNGTKFDTTNFLNSSSTDVYSSNLNEETKDNIIFYVLIIVILIVGCLCLLVFSKRAFSKNSENIARNDQFISNALVIIVAIGEYFEVENVTDPDINTHLRSLPVDKDVENLQHLFRLLNYKIMPQEMKITWTEQEIIKYFKTEIGNELFNQDKELKYDGLIVCVSCHGIENSIITSDYKLIEKTVIHRIVSIEYPETRQIPRLFIFDSCEGSSTREYIDPITPTDDQIDGKIKIDEHKGIKKPKRNKTKANNNITNKDNGAIDMMRNNNNDVNDDELFDIAKYVDIDTNVISRQMPKGVKLRDIETGHEWNQMQPFNPDYKLVQINAANTGFMAKCDLRFGSFLIYEFVKRMKENIEKENKQDLSAIFEAIQNELHDKGKQQTTNTFNNGTGHLYFAKNNQPQISQVIENVEKTITNLNAKQQANSEQVKLETVISTNKEVLETETNQMAMDTEQIADMQEMERTVSTRL